MDAEVVQGRTSNQESPRVAEPRITGINHLVLICKDMNRTADFYANILGMRLKAASPVGRTLTDYGDRVGDAAALAGKPSGLNRLYFLEMGDGSMIVLAEMPEHDTTSEHSFFQPNFWPGAWTPPGRPNKMDHLSFNVNTLDELVYFQKRLRDHGIATSEIENRVRYVKSLYFYDPDQVPLEIATWDYGSPEWADAKPGEHILDPDLVPSLRGAR